MRWTLLAALALLVPMSSAGVVLVHTQSTGTFTPVEVEVPFGSVVAGTSLGANQTNASVLISGSLLQATTDILYLNNTNATGAHYARLEVVTTTNLGALDLVRVGIDNGTQTDQIVFNLGSLTQSTGAYVKLEPGSTNTIYVTQSLGSLTTKGATFWVYSADDPQESAYVKTRAQVTLT